MKLSIASNHEYFSESDLVRHRIVKAADGKADFDTESAVSFHFEKTMKRPHNVRRKAPSLIRHSTETLCTKSCGGTSALHHTLPPVKRKGIAALIKFKSGSSERPKPSKTSILTTTLDIAGSISTRYFRHKSKTCPRSDPTRTAPRVKPTFYIFVDEEGFRTRKDDWCTILPLLTLFSSIVEFRYNVGYAQREFMLPIGNGGATLIPGPLDHQLSRGVTVVYYYRSE